MQSKYYFVSDRDWLIGESVHPGALPKIAKLEEPAPGREAPGEPTFDVPVFISHLNNVECREGDTAHFECKVEPSRDPTMKIGNAFYVYITWNDS